MGTAVAVIEEIPGLVSAEDVKTRIAPLLPPGASVDRVLAAVMYAVRQNQDLARCQPETVIDSVARIQQWGLEVGTTAHLVPFGRTCTPVADYKGLAELMVRSGAVRNVEARVVYEKDQFSYRYGLDAELRHQPSTARERGPITHAYVILRLPFGASSFEVMAIEDIDEIRKRHSKQWKSGPCPAWYAKKTVVRQAAKLVPKDPRFSAALSVIRDEQDAEFASEAPASAPLEREDAIVPPQLTTGADGNDAPEEQAATATRPASEFKDLTLEEARKLAVSDNPKAFKGKGGDLLDSYTTEHLQQLRNWFEEKLLDGHRDDFALRVEAITLILDAREAEQTKLEFEAPVSEPVTGEVSAPGQLADALEPTPEAQAREATPRTRRESTPATADDLPF